VTKPVTINGQSQSGFAGAPVIELANGTGNPGVVGIDVVGGGSSVLSLDVEGFGTGIRLRSGDANTVVGCILSFDSSGGTPGPSTGIQISGASAGNIVGGTGSNSANVVGGNVRGVLIVGAGTTGNLVEGNVIGIGSGGGVGAITNTVGVSIAGGATKNTIGGTSAGARNVISGNRGDGVDIDGSPTTGNVVEGNYVGVDDTGTSGLGNGANGVTVSGGAHGNRIGGTSAGARNVISANTSDGVDLTGSGTKQNLVEGNYVGTDVAGSSSLQNVRGVALLAGAQANTIGGTTAGARNVLSGNRDLGVYVDGSGTGGNVVEGNYIGTDPGGSTKVANDTGVFVAGNVTGNTIGGTAAGARNLISGNGGGVVLLGRSTILEGNWIGTDASGAAPLGNVVGGVAVAGHGNVVGGTSAAARNVVSGNDGYGVSLSGESAVVEGNAIGVDPTGTVQVPNDAGAGVLLVDGATGNTVGGTSAGARNVISGNGGDGICVCGQVTKTVVAGNYIGIDQPGTHAIPNAASGVEFAGNPSANTIGGTTAGARNVISGNDGSGVSLGSSATTRNVVEGNYIGTNPVGGAALGNGLAGVDLRGGAHGNTIGGTTAGARNVIYGNAVGVEIFDSGTSGNLVEGNYIGTNAAGSGALGNHFFGVDEGGGAGGNTIGGTSAAPGT